jgi:hypothetical protein
LAWLSRTIDVSTVLGLVLRLQADSRPRKSDQGRWSREGRRVHGGRRDSMTLLVVSVESRETLKSIGPAIQQALNKSGKKEKLQVKEGRKEEAREEGRGDTLARWFFNAGELRLEQRNFVGCCNCLLQTLSKVSSPSSY